MPVRDLGSEAPPLELVTAAGTPWSLSALRGRTVIVSFLGPASCHFCRAHVIRLIQARERIEETGAEVVLVGHHDPELMMAKMMHSLQLPFILLVDKTRASYRRWGLGTVSFRAFVRPGLYLEMARILVRREKSLGYVSDRSQMGGDFVVGPAGSIVFAHRMRSLHDRPTVETLLKAVRS